MPRDLAECGERDGRVEIVVEPRLGVGQRFFDLLRR